MTRLGRDDAAHQRFVADYLRDLGLEVELFEPAVDEVERHPMYRPGQDFAGRPVIWARLPGRGGGRSLLFNGHMDTVLAGPREGWAHHPWGATIVDVLLWAGTSAGWLGLEADRTLCAAVRDLTGIPATSSVLGLEELLRRDGATSIALVTPYTDAVQDRIVATFRATGIEVLAERHLGIAENFAFAQVDEAMVRTMVEEVAAGGPRAIAPFCTNLAAARLATAVEAELGIRMYDTVATGVWGSLSLAGVDPGQVVGWGGLFDGRAPPGDLAPS